MRDRPAVAGDGEGESLRPGHAQAVHRRRVVCGGGELVRAHSAVDGQVVGERVRLAADREVGEHAVGARVAQRRRHRPRAVGGLRRVQVLEAGHVAAHDDQVHALGVLDVEVADGRAAAIDDPEGERESARRAAPSGAQARASGRGR